MLTYLIQHWNGHHSLARSYWLNAMPPALCLYWLDDALAPLINIFPNTSLLIQVWFSLFFLIALLVVWGSVGLWKAASHRFREKDGGSMKRLFTFGAAESAQVTVFAAVLFYALTYLSVVPAYTELYAIGFKKDPLSDYSLEWGDQEKTWIKFEGRIGFGLNADLKALLREDHNATHIRLQSIGGRGVEAIKVADTIRAAGLSTHVDTECSSACTLLFLAGKERVLDLKSNAQLGFHSPYVTALMGEATDATSSNDYYLELMQFGITKTFADWAISVPPYDMWYPSPQILAEEYIASHFQVEDQGIVSAKEFDFAQRAYSLNEALTILDNMPDELNANIKAHQHALQTGWMSRNERANAYGMNGVSYKILGNHDRSVEAFSEAIRLLPNYASLYFHRGQVLDLMGDSARALADYKTAYRLRPREDGKDLKLIEQHEKRLEQAEAPNALRSQTKQGT